MLASWFVKIYVFFSKRKALLFALMSALIIFSVLLTLKLDFKEDIADFLPSGEKYSEIKNIVSTASGNSKIFIFFQSADSSDYENRTIECMDFFAEKLLKGKDSLLFKDLSYKFDDKNISETSDFILENIPYFLSQKDYLNIDSSLNENRIKTAMEVDKKILQSPAPQYVKNVIRKDPFGLFLNEISGLKNLKPSNEYSYINGHIFESKKSRGIIFFNSPASMSESNINSQIINKLTLNILETEKEFPDIKISLFGAPVIAVCNSSQIKKDTLLTTITSVVLIALILWFSIRSIKNLLLMSLTLIFGFLISGGVAFLVFGKVSLISLGISAVFTGIAANYPLHYITHLYHTKNTLTNLKEIASPLVVGNLTTVAAFFSLMFSDSGALSDLGFMGGVLLLASIIFTLVFLPHLVEKKEIKENNTNSKFNFFNVLQKKTVVIPILCLTPVAVFFSLKTEFDSDLHNINFMTEDLKAEAKHTFSLINSDTTICVYITAKTKDFQKTLELTEKINEISKMLKKENLISSISGISKYIPSNSKQLENLTLWNNYIKQNKKFIIENLEKYANENNLKMQYFLPFKEILEKEYSVKNPDFFMPVIKTGLKNYIQSDSSQTSTVTILKLKPSDSEKVINRFKNIDEGIYAFDERLMAQSLTNALNEDFNYVLFAAGIIVFVFLAISFHSTELCLIAFIPLTISWFWILGLMYAVDIKFNIVNIILATFIFGQGDDYAIFITEGLIYEFSYGKKVLNSFKKSVVISSVIMFVGIGSLILAKHPAMSSLGGVVIIGMFSVVMASLIFPPLIFKMLAYQNGKKRFHPHTIKDILMTGIYFIGFVGACTILFISSLKLKLRNFKSMEDKIRLHKVLKKLSMAVKWIPGTKFIIDNPENENFQKPAIIIANHSSIFDVLCLMYISDKILFVTNDNQQKNLLYGHILKSADFLPASDGYDKLAEKFSPYIQNGFSVVVFPEGTRSTDMKIHRFHQGAFYLAKYFNLDILPVIIHGAGRTMSKNDFLLSPSKITLSIQKRITPNNEMISDTVLETTRNIRHYMVDLYDKIAEKCEDMDFVKNIIKSNFLYKGYDAAKSLKKSFNKNLQLFENKNNIQKVCFINSGYGELPLLYSLLNKKTSVKAYEDDPEKILFSENCVDKPQNLKYYSKNEFSKEEDFDLIFVIDQDIEDLKNAVKI
ncbi:MAG: 1-acyl-sn-glycerol-3-phosphate acyltransferase [Bacteroidales bacterium]|nr:1-acyl-sn-glycerol-3-phosphate acyltransferase [Bacteroidales bacterium]